MKEKKHIDSLFKESFKNFEANPSPQVWKNIQAELNHVKKERKIIPLWIKLGGIAALLALLFTVSNSVFNNQNTITPNITEDNQHPKNNNNHSVISEKNKVEKIEIATEITNNTTQEQQTIQKQKLPLPNIKNNNTNYSENKIAIQKNNPIPTTPLKQKNANSINKKYSISKTQEKIAQQTKKHFQKKNNQAPQLENKENVIVKNISTEEKITSDIAINSTNEKQEIEKKTENKKPSILEVIEEQEQAKEAIVTTKEKLENRWEVSPNFAPVFYSSINNGSSIDPEFSDNPKDSDVNFSYGVQISYALSERFSVRTGVSTVDLSYSTSGIELGNGPVSIALKSVDYGNQQSVLTAFDIGTLNNPENEGSGYGEITPKSTNGSASIQQEINYYEVPLELKYALLNKRFGVHLIGGLSTLFLGDNKISVEAGDFKSTLGEANNLSSVSFTTNVGLGVHYGFSKKLRFQIEPMFKYQINTYTDSSVDYKPYYIGVYTGLSFKF